MFLVPANTIKWRLARNWAKMQSTRQWDYRVADSPVINNKPHIILSSVPMAYPQQQPTFMTLGNLLGGMKLPEGDEDEEMEIGVDDDGNPI